MRAGVAISVFGHGLALVLGLIYAGASPFDPTPADAITVDIVTPDEMAQAANEVPPLPQTPPETPSKMPPDTFSLSAKPAKAAPFNLLPSAASQQPTQQQTPQQASKPTPQSTPAQSPQQVAQQQQNPQRTVRQAAASPPPRAPPEPPQLAPAQPPPPDPAPEEHGLPNMFGMPIMLPGGRVGGAFDAPAYETAKVDHDETTAFREHLKTCSTLPAEVLPTDKIRIVLRVNLKPDGTLASPPTVIEGSPSAKALVLKQSAIQALSQCQPYTMLPADKYKEWKALDLPFTPQDFTGG
jgi:hypothetical protein